MDWIGLFRLNDCTFCESMGVWGLSRALKNRGRNPNEGSRERNVTRMRTGAGAGTPRQN